MNVTLVCDLSSVSLSYFLISLLLTTEHYLHSFLFDHLSIVSSLSSYYLNRPSSLESFVIEIYEPHYHYVILKAAVAMKWRLQSQTVKGV